MTGTDPAIEAAQRAAEDGRLTDDLMIPGFSVREFGVTASREALAPIRELHRRSPVYPYSEECNDLGHDDYIETTHGEYVCPDCPPVDWTCAECAEAASYADELPEWPFDTAKHCFTSEELNHD